MQDEDPRVWGPSFWIVMRKVAERYPKHNAPQEVRVAAAAWYNAYSELLPCGKCREHYKYLLQKYPIELYLENATVLKDWVETIKRDVDAKKRSEKSPDISSGQEAMIRFNRVRKQIPQIRRVAQNIRRPDPVPSGSVVVPQAPVLRSPHVVAPVQSGRPGRPGCRTCAGKKRFN